MRTTTNTRRTILGLLASGALLAGCSGDARRETADRSLLDEHGVAMPASLPASVEPGTVPVDPATAKAAWTDGVLRFDNGDYSGAVEPLRVAVAGSPDTAYRHYLLGLALWKSGSPEGAEVSLVESARLDATRVKTWINLARVRHDRSDRSGALEAAETALALDPASADAMHQKGRALMELKRGEEALEALKSARALDPGNGYIANTLGLLLIQTGQPAESVEPLEAAKAALPHVAYVRNNLGVAYERTGRLAEAKLEYLAAVEGGDGGGKAMQSLVRLGGKDAEVVTASAQTE